MKRIRVMVSVCLMFLSHLLMAQTAQVEIVRKVSPLRITVSNSLTTNLIFPYSIKSVDKGSKELLVQKAIGVENVLQAKASKEDLEQTNLTVITADGQLYSFLVSYEKMPFHLNIELGKIGIKREPEAIFSQAEDNEARVSDAAQQVALKRPVLNKPRDRKYDISMRLTGLYIKDDLHYYQLALENTSNVNYSIGQLRFFIKDQKKSKRTAAQEIELIPEQIIGDSKLIRSNSAQVVVVAMPKTIIPDQKFLYIQMMERGGGRNLSIQIQNRNLVGARLL